MKNLAFWEKNRVIYIKSGEIIPNPAQPRKSFEPNGLKELANSIRELGILQPLTVRKSNGGYELVAGERRLRASRMAGLSEVPCIVTEADEQRSSLIALVENLQRRDLDFFEEAEGIKRLIDLYGLSQEEASRRLGKSQPAVANKLRILRFDEQTRDIMRNGNLTERHARALLRVEKPESRREVLELIIERGLNVAQTEAYIDDLLTQKPARIIPIAQPPQKNERPAKIHYIVKDVRLFLNTVERAVDVMRGAGVAADMEKEELDDEIILKISIPRKKAKITALQ
ncbi:MAG: ParB/RepB/Spo0J family partition protein [Oscillospiraceae bacterium]|nr:ParB/RepB/Spo0J family partition protein [Oscillospiraceae bacterium]